MPGCSGCSAESRERKPVSRAVSRNCRMSELACRRALCATCAPATSGLMLSLSCGEHCRGAASVKRIPSIAWQSSGECLPSSSPRTYPPLHDLGSLAVASWHQCILPACTEVRLAGRRQRRSLVDSPQILRHEIRVARRVISRAGWVLMALAQPVCFGKGNFSSRTK